MKDLKEIIEALIAFVLILVCIAITPLGWMAMFFIWLLFFHK